MSSREDPIVIEAAALSEFDELSEECKKRVTILLGVAIDNLKLGYHFGGRNPDSSHPSPRGSNTYGFAMPRN